MASEYARRTKYHGFTEYDEDSDIVELFEELKNKYNVRDVDDCALERTANQEELEQADNCFEDKLNKLNDKEQRDCSSCSTKVRVESTSSFEHGQHIARPGDLFKTHFKFLQKQVCPYDHHMIVKEVVQRSTNKAEMVVIHFTRTEDDDKIKVYEESVTIDLRYDDVYRVEYPRSKYSQSEIVQRAESMLTEHNKYNFFTSNCEHFATWCVVGEGKSFQVQSLKQKITDAVIGIFGDSSTITKGILRILINSADEISSKLSKAANVPGYVLIGLTGIYLLYCIFKSYLYYKDYNDRIMCWSCMKKNIIDLWLAFVVFGATSAIQYLVFTFALPLISNPAGIILMILVILLSIGLQISVSKFTRVFRSPFTDEGQIVADMSKIQIGDIVRFKYFKFDHIALVTDVHEKGMKVIHYAAPSTPSGDRMVKEEYFPVDLNDFKVKVIDTMCMKCYPSNLAVERARKRLGETKFDCFTNRSSQLCYWAKADLRNAAAADDELGDEKLGESKSKVQSTLHTGKKEIYLIEDLELGDVVLLGFIPLGNRFVIDTKGILVDINIQRNGKIQLGIMVHQLMRVRLVTRLIDLKTDRLFVYRYAKGQCKTKRERWQSAKKMQGSYRFWFTTDGFIEACIMLDSK